MCEKLLNVVVLILLPHLHLSGPQSASSIQFSRSVVADSLRPRKSQHARPPCPSPTPEVHPNSCASSRWCHPAISSSVVPFSSCPQSLPASESFSNELTLRMRWPKYWSARGGPYFWWFPLRSLAGLGVEVTAERLSKAKRIVERSNSWT